LNFIKLVIVELAVDLAFLDETSILGDERLSAVGTLEAFFVPRGLVHPQIVFVVDFLGAPAAKWKAVH
jgi:hypothetical protein